MVFSPTQVGGGARRHSTPSQGPGRMPVPLSTNKNSAWLLLLLGMVTVVVYATGSRGLKPTATTRSLLGSMLLPSICTPNTALSVS